MECRFSRKTDDQYLIWGYVPPRSGEIKQLLHWGPRQQQPTYITQNTHHYLAFKDFARKRITLKILNTTKQDSTRYFCQLTDHLVEHNRTDFCGCGTTLDVTA
ncbi:hypothetical protein scyTo_0026544, partial [Scyliorhinus torazame]|nr:hypothetical protein [Scyliorhinus torazame]